MPPFLRDGSKSEIYSPVNGNRFNITTSSFINGEEGLNEHGLAVATSDEYAPFDDANGDDYDSGKRYKVVVDSFTNKIKDDYLEETKQLLMGKYGFMCQYEDPNFETVWSSIFDLESLMIYRAEGDPRKKRFISDNRLHGMKFGR